MNHAVVQAIASGHRRWGHIADPESRRTQRDARALFLTRAAPLPKNASLAHLAAPTMDQGSGMEGTGSCFGHGSSQLCYQAFAAAGDPLPWIPSQGGIYKLARIWDRPAALPGADPVLLQDVGSMPSSGAGAMAKWGIWSMQVAMTSDGRVSDVTVGNVNDEPDFLSLEQGALKIVVGEYRIDETAPDAIDQICASIAGAPAEPGFPVGVGFFADSAFMNWQPSQGPLDTVDLSDTNGGGHWADMDTFDTSLVSGKPALGILNSWGPGWANRGRIEVTENWVRRAVSDLYPWKVRRLAA